MAIRRIFLTAAFFSSILSLRAQFSGPVASTYNPGNNKYYICNNYGKDVVSIDANNNKATFITGLTSPNNILFASLPLGEGFIVLDSNEIKGYDSAGTYYASFTTPGALELYDGVFDVISQALYISDIDRGVIYKTTFGPAPFYLPTTVIFSTPHRRPSAMVLQKSKNRILYVEDTASSQLMAISLSTGQTSTVVSLGLDNCVGLAEDGQGNLYISSQGAKAIYQLNKYYTGSPKKLLTEPKPGDLLVNVLKDQWVYTCIQCGTVFIPPLHSFGPGTEMELCPESTFPGYKNSLIKNIGTFDAGNSFIMELSNSSGSFVGATFLGSVTDTLIPDSIVGKLPKNLPAGTGYRYRWRSTKPAVIGAFERLSILAKPAVAVSSYDTVQACTGSKILLGENNPVVGVSYQWLPLNAVDSPSNAMVYHTVDSGMWIYLNAVGTNGCANRDSAWMKPVSIPDPGPFDDTVKVCKGSIATLGPTPNGSFQYLWSPGILLDDSTLAQPHYSGTVNQTFTLVLKAAGGCQSNFQQSVSVLDPPVFFVLVDTVKLCVAKTMLNSVVHGYPNSRCLWIDVKKSDTFVGNDRSFHSEDSGIFRVILTDLNTGCSSEKEVVQIKIPELYPGIAKVGQTLTLSIPLSNIEWFKNDTIYTKDSTSIYVTQSGKYKVCGNNEYNCQVCSPEETMVINSTLSPVKMDCAIYPIPVENTVNLQCHTRPSQKWVLTSIGGKELLRGEQHQIDISRFKNGMYLLKLENGTTYKLIKTTK